MKSIIISSLMAASMMFLLSGCYGTTTATSGAKTAKCGDGKCGAAKTSTTKCGAGKCGTSK